MRMKYYVYTVSTRHTLWKILHLYIEKKSKYFRSHRLLRIIKIITVLLCSAVTDHYNKFE